MYVNFEKYAVIEFWWKGPVADEPNPWEFMRKMCAKKWLMHHKHEEKELFSPKPIMFNNRCPRRCNKKYKKYYVV